MSLSLEHDYIGLSELPTMRSSCSSGGLNLKATELRLGLPGSESPERNGYKLNFKSPASAGAKRAFSDAIDSNSGNCGSDSGVKDGVSQSPKTVLEKKTQGSAPAAKAQVVGWPPIRSFRKNSMASHPQKNDDDAEGKSGSGCLYVKVSMDGAPYLRKVDLTTYGSYVDLSSALEKMFRGFTIGQCGTHGVPSRDGLSESRLMDLLNGSEYVLTYEDKDGDWMLVGDVPWEMFTESCKRMRIMKSSDAIGLAPRAVEKCKNQAWNG